MFTNPYLKKEAVDSDCLRDLDEDKCIIQVKPGRYKAIRTYDDENEIEAYSTIERVGDCQ